MLHTTFKLLKDYGACEPNYSNLGRAMGGIKKYGRNTPIPLTKILEHNGLYDALWALRAVLSEEEAKRDKISRLIVCDFAENAIHIFEKQLSEDKCLRKTIEIARKFANGEVTRDELDAAHDVAFAAHAAYAANATYNAYVAAAVVAHAYATATAADAAVAVAYTAARVAYVAADAEKKFQIKTFFKYMNES